MTAIWHFFWPVLVLSAIVGVVSGRVAFQRPGGRKPSTVMAAGALVAVARAGLWYWPGGAARRFTMSVERQARVTLGNYEMTQVSARLQSNPTTRTIVLSGPADDFQQSELVKIIGLVPGVGRVRWDRPVAQKKRTLNAAGR